MKLSVVVPVYNEARCIEASVERLLAVPLPTALEVVIVDNGSRDGTLEILHARMPSWATRGVRLIEVDRPIGKGAAVLRGMSACDGDWFLVHDADLEYDPGDIPALLAPLIAGTCDLVNGTRFGRDDARFLFDLHRVFNRSLTTAVNLSYAAHLTDLTSCYKAARLAVWRSFRLRSRGFALETEILCQALRRGLRVREVPIRYQARTYEEGKKIRPRDALPILATLLRVRVLGR